MGINVASEPASRDGESSALDGLLDQERPRGRAGEGSGARARCAADQGGDRHCDSGGEAVRGCGAEMGRSLGVVRAAASALLLRCSIGLSRLEILADARARQDGT